MKKIYRNVNILDGTRDMSLQKDMMVTVEDGKIVSIKKNDKATEGIDLGGRYMIPGLINLHVHTPGTGFPKKKQSDSRKVARLVMSNVLLRKVGLKICENAVKTELLSGTTTIRTVGGLGDFDSTMRDLVGKGKLEGPRIISCDQAVTVPGGHMEGSVAYGAKDEDDFVSFIKKTAKKADWIKIMITGGVLDATVKGEPGEMRMNEDQVRLCCETAHSLNKKVCAHVESPKGVEVALKCGVDSIEHGAMLTDELVKQFKKSGSALICTLSPAVPLAKFDPEVTGGNEIQRYNSEVLLEGIIEGTKKCLKAGVKVGMGTDTVCPFVTQYDMWRELEYMHLLCGIDRKTCLHLATENNAQIIGVDGETGSIEEGKMAEFIIVDSDPLQGFDTIRDPYMVVFRDKEYKEPKVKKSNVAERYLDGYLNELKA
ncbi:MAG: amidohydrolase family protein [Erysipelotrichaceae bacterium]|nr:amidohydrolase family protein [Erysipelotrichaceae bacterium]